VFDYEEIESSFYRIPTVFMVNNWAKRTPKNFKFTAKFPRAITHEKRLKHVDKELEQFFEATPGVLHVEGHGVLMGGESEMATFRGEAFGRISSS
jgi:uncharacterized protein YecE (DUF72 family)